MTERSGRLCVLALASLAFHVANSQVCQADITRTIPFQGVLAGPTGVPKPDGAYTVTFRLYDALTGGNLVWTEAGKTVQVAGHTGVFSTALGSDTPFGALVFDVPYFLEIQAAGDPAPMTPRLPLQSVPYAFQAGRLVLPFRASAATGASPLLQVQNTGNGWAIEGDSAGSGVGVLGVANSNAGVFGQSTASYGVGGTSTGSLAGVAGTNTVGSGVGVFGQSRTNAGVYGTSEGSYGLYGESGAQGNDGVHGVARVPGKSGVYGENNNSGGYGVYGSAQGVAGIGVLGTASGSANSKGVYGSTLHGFAVFGSGDDSGATGVHGQNAAGAYGELGTTSSVGGFPVAVGVLASLGSSSGYGLVVNGASDLNGFVAVHGSVICDSLFLNGSKNFRIDDPLDPPNKTLTHACAEGPEPLDLYSGNITTDASGTAVVQLPPYFEALNKDFRYQLTCIGQFAQAIVAEKIQGNRFTVKTDKPGVEVSWQVTGVRNDAYMRKHPTVAEEWKPADQRGRYLDPASYDLPASKTMAPHAHL